MVFFGWPFSDSQSSFNIKKVVVQKRRIPKYDCWDVVAKNNALMQGAFTALLFCIVLPKEHRQNAAFIIIGNILTMGVLMNRGQGVAMQKIVTQQQSD